MYVNKTKHLGPTSFAHGYIYSEETFTTCSCSCSVDCSSLNRACCVDENTCGICLPGYSSSNGPNSYCHPIGEHKNFLAFIRKIAKY